MNYNGKDVKSDWGILEFTKKMKDDDTAIATAQNPKHCRQTGENPRTQHLHKCFQCHCELE